MTTAQIVKAQDFAQVAEVRSDDKRRIALTRVRRATRAYRIYENSLGQIILDPVVTIPASEAWIYEDKEVLASIRRGLKESARGKLLKKPSLAKHAHDRLESR